ncbi:MAG: hypothetical protein WDO68_07660 [Gammaproteobacteria bacterium]
MLLALTAALAIVAQDQSSLRSEPRSGATELTALSQGDLVEIRGEQAEYLKVYNYRQERGGYLRREAARPLGLTENDAPELLSVLRFLRDGRGSEALGISYGAAYLKAAPTQSLTAEPFEAIARMAERLADAASGNGPQSAALASHLQVVEQFGVHMRTFERNRRMQVCYDGDLYRRVLTIKSANAEQRAYAVLGLTRPDCIDPNLGPTARMSLDNERRQLLELLDVRELSAPMRSRVSARGAAVWASVTFARARRQQSPAAAAQRALDELLAVDPGALGEDRRSEYVDSAARVSAIRWGAEPATTQKGPLVLSTTPGETGQTCVALKDTRRPREEPLARRCTYGIAWMGSAKTIPSGPALVLAVQPLESWLELWVFHEVAGNWTVDVLSPGADDPELGYVEYAGFAPETRRLLIVREVKERGRFRRRFELLRLDDLAQVRFASTPDLLRDFGRSQDIAWKRDTLSLH